MSTQPRLELVNPEVIRYAWEREQTDTDRAFEAFEIYRMMGHSRTLTKVADKLQKSLTIIRRWAKRDNWEQRVQAFDRHEARIINARIIAGTASMRERQINAAQAIMNRTQARVLSMTQQDIDRLRPLELAALLRVATEIERNARDFEEEEDLLPELQPNFVIQFISQPKGMVAAQLHGHYGYIPEDKVDEFRRRFPDAVVVI